MRREDPSLAEDYGQQMICSAVSTIDDRVGRLATLHAQLQMRPGANANIHRNEAS